MAVVKVIEVIADSDQSWEHAAQEAVRHASLTIRNIKSVYVQDTQAMVENNKITRYRVNAKISFVVEE